MSRTLTAADRSALIRLANTMPAGSEERRAILAGLQKQARPVNKSLMNKAHSLLERGTKRLRTHDVFGDVYDLHSRKTHWSGDPSESAIFYFVGGDRKKRDLEQAAKKALAPISDQIESMFVGWTQDVTWTPAAKQYGPYDELRVELRFR
jgi:hypothetical protein